MEQAERWYSKHGNLLIAPLMELKYWKGEDSTITRRLLIAPLMELKWAIKIMAKDLGVF